MENGQNAAEFVKGILPSKMVAEVEKEAAAESKKTELETAPPVLANATSVTEPADTRKFKEYTREELLALSNEAFSALVPARPQDMTKEQLMVAMQRRTS